MAEINKIIKNARDVLVGKVPDPQSQIDQITLALIYKFMDAKDREARGYDLPATFFVGEYEDYSFTKIMQATSNPEKFNLYSKGIELLQNRTDLPSTFVSVFKDAFIPYRDPQTLNLFLAEIDKIPTDNTELLGTAFEDLLSIMGSQGDAGQFRTPRHIIDMIVEIVNPQKGKTILDPACGTAGFLISAYNKISKANLSVEEREHLMNDGLVGYDINPNMVKLANVNLFLHNCKKPNIHLYDTLSEKTYWKDNYDVILANPPFMTPRGGIRPHELFNAINANRSEVLFTYYIAKHLKKDGKAGVIVPEGVVFQSANTYKNLRKMLIQENYLYAVISLPSGVFNPYSGVKTSILLMDKAIARKTDNILFVKMNNDGFDLGAQRRSIEQNDIPNIISLVKEYISCVHNDNAECFEDKFGISILANKEEIAENDYILVGDRYRKQEETCSQYPLVKLENLLCKIRYPEKLLRSQFKATGKYPIIDQSENFIAGYYDDESMLIHLEKPVICFGDHTLVLKYVDFDFILGADGVKILVPIDAIDTKYLYYVLKTNPIESRGYSRHYTYLKELKIPHPPIEIQRQIVAEIESYQKIIDGAKQVVANYSPKINLDSNWQKLRLDEISIEIKNGINVQQINSVGKYRVTRIATIAQGIVDLNNTKWTNDEPVENYFMKEGDILLSHINSYEHLAKTAIYHENGEKVVHGINLIRIRTNRKLIDPNYLIIYLKSKEFIERARSFAQRAVNQASINIANLKSIMIPCPSLSEQEAIIEKIVNEQRLMDSCEELISIFEQKIKDKISEVWGE